MNCLTCRYRYTSDDFWPQYSACLVYNAATEISPYVVHNHVMAERERLGRLPTFDQVENCPAYEAEEKPCA